MTIQKRTARHTLLLPKQSVGVEDVSRATTCPRSLTALHRGQGSCVRRYNKTRSSSCTLVRTCAAVDAADRCRKPAVISPPPHNHVRDQSVTSFAMTRRSAGNVNRRYLDPVQCSIPFGVATQRGLHARMTAALPHRQTWIAACTHAGTETPRKPAVFRIRRLLPAVRRPSDASASSQVINVSAVLGHVDTATGPIDGPAAQATPLLSAQLETAPRE